jgi:phosphoserine phosphatase
LKTEILLIRHGEVNNPKNIEYIRLPGFGLSEIGRKQITNLSLEIKSKNITKIYSSPLERTSETAEILSSYLSENNIKKIPIIYNEDLLEANFYKWQGINRNKRDKDELNGYWNDPLKYSALLGESLKDVQNRMVSQIKKIARLNKGEVIIIVSHSAPIVAARLYFEKIPLENFWNFKSNFASITSISLNNKLECERVEYNEYNK